ncbi:hypothetical protein, partial [Pseudomonas viridiflava]|uniref:hypothetical protein n=1 Tax=Pseudomonas viridiflava TaxID=33069 RepID=UPI00198070CB
AYAGTGFSADQSGRPDLADEPPLSAEPPYIAPLLCNAPQRSAGNSPAIDPNPRIRSLIRVGTTAA